MDGFCAMKENVDEEKTIREHIEELKALAKKLFFPLLLLFIFFFWLAGPLSAWMLEYYSLTQGVVALSPFENLNARTTIAFSLTVLFGLPILFFGFFRYSQPIFSKKNSRRITFLFITSMCLSAIGALVGILFFAKIILEMLATTYLLVTPLWSITSVLKQIITLAITGALILQLLLIIPLLIKAGLLSQDDLKKHRSEVFITTLVLGAIISPPDPLSMFLMSIPIYASYEAGLLISILTKKKR